MHPNYLRIGTKFKDNHTPEGVYVITDLSIDLDYYKKFKEFSFKDNITGEVIDNGGSKVLIKGFRKMFFEDTFKSLVVLREDFEKKIIIDNFKEYFNQKA